MFPFLSEPGAAREDRRRRRDRTIIPAGSPEAKERSPGGSSGGADRGGRLNRVNARSALFDLYGDHLLARGGAVPVAALVRLLAPLGIAAPAVRTAVSRMVRQGWLEPCRLGDGPGYSLTERARRRLAEAAERIYRTHTESWDGTWHLLALARPRGRSARERLMAGLGFLGYAPLGEASWIAPRPAPGLDEVLTADGAAAERFRVTHEGDSRALAARAWDLDALGREYERWLAEARRMLAERGAEGDTDVPDEEAFAVRFRLVHEWRKFLFRDPGLPRELLPPRWPGHRAADFFDAEASRLLPAAARFVDASLRADPAATGGRSGAADG